MANVINLKEFACTKASIDQSYGAEADRKSDYDLVRFMDTCTEADELEDFYNLLTAVRFLNGADGGKYLPPFLQGQGVEDSMLPRLWIC